MKLAIMQPYIFPYIGYFQLIHAVNKFVIYDDVTYIKQGWINRNRIIISGKTSYITVPLSGASSFALINTVQIARNNWQSKWLKTLQQSYIKAKSFNVVFPILESILLSDVDHISTLAVNSIKAICTYLDLSTPLQETSTTYQNNHLRSEQRVIDICQQENCQEYINAMGGMNLYSKETFHEKNIALRFLKPHEITYKQFDSVFVPNLSIIDVLMHNTKEEAKRYLDEYQLI